MGDNKITYYNYNMLDFNYCSIKYELTWWQFT